MTPQQFKIARQCLGLSRTQMALLLGYKGKNTRVMMYQLETGKKSIREPQIRLMKAYIAGYRPGQWPG